MNKIESLAEEIDKNNSEVMKRNAELEFKIRVLKE